MRLCATLSWNIEISSLKNKYFLSLLKKLLIILFCQDFINLIKIKELSKNKFLTGSKKRFVSSWPPEWENFADDPK